MLPVRSMPLPIKRIPSHSPTERICAGRPQEWLTARSSHTASRQGAGWSSPGPHSNRKDRIGGQCQYLGGRRCSAIRPKLCLDGNTAAPNASRAMSATVLSHLGSKSMALMLPRGTFGVCGTKVPILLASKRFQTQYILGSSLGAGLIRLLLGRYMFHRTC